MRHLAPQRGVHTSPAIPEPATPPSPSVSDSVPLSLRRNFAWAFVANAIYAASQWGVVVLLAKWGSAEMIGELGIALAVSTPIITFCQLQLRPIQVTDAAQHFRLGHYLALSIVMMLLALAIVSGVAGLAYRPSFLLILVIAINQAIDSYRDSFQGAMQKHERMDRASISRMVTGLLYATCFALGLRLAHSLLLAASAAIFARLAIMFLYDMPQVIAIEGQGRSVLRPVFEFKPLWRLGRLGLVLGLALSILTLEWSIPRFFLERLYGTQSVGFYVALWTLGQAGLMVVAALGQSASPRLARHYLEDRHAFAALVLKMFLLGLLLGVAGVLVAVFWGKPLLAILFKPEYVQYHSQLVLIMISSGILYASSFLGYSLTAARRVGVQVAVSVTAAVVMLVFSLLLVGPYGITGAAWAGIAAAGVRCASQTIIIVRAIRA